MAQLRDAQTSALILEGTPLELALAADELGRDEVLFDDVGPAFDPDAVVEAHKERAASLTAAAKDAKGEDRKRLEAAAKDATSALKLERRAIESASKALERARAA